MAYDKNGLPLAPGDRVVLEAEVRAARVDIPISLAVSVFGAGVQIIWADDRAVVKAGTDDALLALVLDRLLTIQEGPKASTANMEAIDALRTAVDAIQRRGAAAG